MVQHNPEFDRWVREGDSHRDARRYPSAAQAYRRALDLTPTAAGIWVQLGNMEKDSGRLREAEMAYRAALTHGADAGDTNLQLGRALKLEGRREEALVAFTAALQHAPQSSNVAQELIALGDSWTVQRHAGLGLPLVAALLASLGELKAAVRRIEGLLPEATALASIPLERYDLFRRLYRVPPPPAGAMAAASMAVVVCAGKASLEDALASLASLTAQTVAPATATLLATTPDLQAAAAQAAQRMPGRFVAGPAARSGGEKITPALLRGAVDVIAATDWICLTQTPLYFDPEALAWLGTVAAQDEAIAWFCDEDVAGPSAHGERSHRDPVLKGAFDPELLAQGRPLGTLVAARRDILLACIDKMRSGLSGNEGVETWWLELCRLLADAGRIGHVPRVLVSTFGGDADAPSPPAAARNTKAGKPPSPPNPGTKITVIVPTRDQVALLQPCIESLRRTARAAAALDIVIVDNGSTDSATCAFLTDGAQANLFRVIRREGPFNWSSLNNAAVADSDAPLLVFANNDLELLTANWDDLVRFHLARADVGAVGARLVYPDRSVQHAGIVLGIGPGRTEHEGRDALETDGGPQNRWRTRRTVRAVTGAFLACRRDTFERAGRFDAEHLPVHFNDVDFCLRLASEGLRTIYEPAIEALHHESKTLKSVFTDTARDVQFRAAADLMVARWGRMLDEDPYFNPHFARWGTPFRYITAPPVGAAKRP